MKLLHAQPKKDNSRQKKLNRAKKTLIVLHACLSCLLLAAACTQTTPKQEIRQDSAVDESQGTVDTASDSKMENESDLTSRDADVIGKLPEAMSLEEAVRYISESDAYILIDVRTEAEYNDGHVPGAILLPLDQIEATIKDIVPDKDDPVLLYCRSGNRSGQAARILRDLGYTSVSNAGGIQGYAGEIVK